VSFVAAVAVDPRSGLTGRSRGGFIVPKRVVTDQQDRRSPMAEALDWVSRITTVALVMVVPGVAGMWLDRRWGTKFVGLMGFAVGLPAGMWLLFQMTRPRPTRDDSDGDDVS